MTVGPTFIGIGAEKSATSWCWACLSEHPDVFMSHPKEINYFNRDENYSRGRSWYTSHFSGARGRVSGEITPLYLDSREASERIMRDFPEAIILVILRNPYERALSHMLMDFRDEFGAVSTLSSEEATKYAARDDKYIRRSLYAAGLEPYFLWRCRDRLRILFYDEMVADPARFVGDLYAAVGASRDFLPAALNERINATGDMRFLPLFKMLRKTAHLARRNAVTEPLVRWAHRIHLTDWVTYNFQKVRGKPILTFDEVFPAKAKESIMKDVQRLSSEFSLALPDGWLQCG